MYKVLYTVLNSYTIIEDWWLSVIEDIETYCNDFHKHLENFQKGLEVSDRYGQTK